MSDTEQLRNEVDRWRSAAASVEAAMYSMENRHKTEIAQLRSRLVEAQAAIATLTDQRDSLLADMQASENAMDEGRYE